MTISISVADEAKLEINRGYLQKLNARRAYIRPRTTRALRALSGLRTEAPPELRDEDAFEHVNDTQDLHRLAPDDEGQLGGLKPAFVRAIIRSLPRDKRIPRSVRLIQRARRSSDCCGQESKESDDRDTFPIVRDLEYRVPDWIRDLRVYLEVYLLDSILVGSNATLIIGQDVTTLELNDITLHAGGKIIQRSPHLYVSAYGSVKGNI